MSIHWPIYRRLLTNLRRVLIHDDQRSYTGAALAVGSLHLAEHLSRLSESRTVGVLLPTSGAFPMTALAGWSLGKTVVPLNYLLKPDELQYVIDDCGADAVVTVRPMLDFLKHEPANVRIVRLEDVSFRGVPDPRWPMTADASDLAVLLYTSGTSGRPKGVMLTHGNLLSNVEQIQRFVHFGRDDIIMGVLPQFHSFGLTVLTLLPLITAMRTVYTARFIPSKLLRLIRRHRPTAFIGIPSMFHAMLHLKDATPDDFASLRFVVSGGEPLPEAVSVQFRERFGVTISEGYGLTETAPVTNMCRPEEFRPHSVGPALPGVRERIVDAETGRDLPPGAEGEIRIAGPNVMRGYHNLPEETAAAFDDRGDFRTGDIGRLDDDGHLYITGRIKEMLIVGGENVFPREIEEALNAHPSVAASGVIGLPDPVRGETPLAFVELRDGEDFDERRLLAHCRSRLAGYKVPRRIQRVDALPRNATGKILRRDLRAMADDDPPGGAESPREPVGSNAGSAERSARDGSDGANSVGRDAASS